MFIVKMPYRADPEGDVVELPCSVVLQTCLEALRAHLANSMEPAEIDAEVQARIEATSVRYAMPL